jgi:Magnesium chelatase, subunit ChlI
MRRAHEAGRQHLALAASDAAVTDLSAIVRGFIVGLDGCHRTRAHVPASCPVPNDLASRVDRWKPGASADWEAASAPQYLYLNELLEFGRHVLAVLRQSLEKGVVTTVRISMGSWYQPALTC